MLSLLTAVCKILSVKDNIDREKLLSQLQTTRNRGHSRKVEMNTEGSTSGTSHFGPGQLMNENNLLDKIWY